MEVGGRRLRLDVLPLAPALDNRGIPGSGLAARARRAHARRQGLACVLDHHAAAGAPRHPVGHRARLRPRARRVRGHHPGRREHPGQDVHARAHHLPSGPARTGPGRVPTPRDLDAHRLHRAVDERAGSPARGATLVNLTLSHLRYSVPGFVLQVNAVLEGQVVALFGPSGAGKTSLLDLIAGLRLPDSGRIQLDGSILSDRESRRWVPTQARGVGYVFQDQALFPHLSVRRNVSYGAHKGGGGNGMFTLDHVAEVLEIGTLLDRRPVTLSGGEKQRVALARALLSQPRVLLLDEPLSNLDESLREQSLGLLRRVRDEFGVPMVYVSHRAQ